MSSCLAFKVTKTRFLIYGGISHVDISFDIQLVLTILEFMNVTGVGDYNTSMKSNV